MTRSVWCGAPGTSFSRGAAHLVELFHEVGFGVETAGGVDDEDVGGAGFGGGACVVECGGGVAALLGFDDLDVGALGPDFELLDGSGAEGVGGAEEDGARRPIFSGGEVGGELAGGGGFAGAVDPNHHDDFGRSSGMLDGAGYAVEYLLQLGLEELLEFVAALDAGAEGALAQVFHDDRGGGGAEIGGEEKRLEVEESGFVDFAGEGDDGADGLGEGLAGAGDRLLHSVEEAEFLGGGFLFGLRFVRVFRACRVFRRVKRRPCWV